MTESNEGIGLGRHFDDATGKPGDSIPYTDERHLLIFGPNGSGKGTRFLIPALLSNSDRSIICVDPKGELCAVTRGYRATLGDVVILNPFNVLGLGSGGFNPLDALDETSPDFFDDAAGIGEALIKVSDKDPHWGESAQGLAVAMVMWEKLTKGGKASLHNVRKMLTAADEWEPYDDKDGKQRRRLIGGFRDTVTKMLDWKQDDKDAAAREVIASLAGRFTGDNNELASIRSTADTQTRWLLSPPIAADISRNGVDFRGLKDRITTVYVILPAERMRTHSVWLRLVIVSALRALYRAGGLRTLLMIDEMPALGYLGPLEDAFGLVRGYKVQIAGICQDLGQLKALYKERWESFLANAGAVMCFAPNDLTTSEWMSKRAGQTTVIVPSESEARSPTDGRQNDTTSWNPAARAAWLQHELMGFPAGTGLLFLAGMENGARFFAPPYWKIATCRERAAPNPYVEA